MFDIGFMELLVLAIIGMVVIGPERLPGAARTVGRQVGQLRRFLSNLQNQLEQEVKLEERNRKIMEATKGQTFGGKDAPQAPSHRDEDAEVPATPPPGDADPDRARQRPSSSEPPESEETQNTDEARKP